MSLAGMLLLLPSLPVATVLVRMPRGWEQCRRFRGFWKYIEKEWGMYRSLDSQQTTCGSKLVDAPVKLT